LLYIINLNIFENEAEKQAFIDKRDNNGKTALHLSVISKSIRTALKLLQNGANPDIKDNSGKTPYQLAIEKNQNSIAQILRNSQRIQFCNLKAPTKKTKKSIRNILIVFVSQFISIFIMIISTIPFGTSIIDSNFLFIFIVLLVYFVLLSIFFLIYIILLCLNPGEVPANNISVLNGLIEHNKDLTNFCYKCYVQKQSEIKHCCICDKCYYNFDHHCYWINKCIAQNNYFLFMMFLFFTFIYLCFTLFINILGIIALLKGKDKNEEIFNLNSIKFINNYIDKNKRIHLALNILLVVLILVFLIPEVMLLFLHNYFLCCSEYKSQKKENSLKKEVEDIEENLINWNE
jgi:palmitoyltransferase